MMSDGVSGVAMQGGIPAHSGRTSLSAVETINKTSVDGALGEMRMEFFPTLLSTDLLPAAAPTSSTCDGWSEMSAYSQLTLSPSWTSITVSWPGSVLELFGNLGGANAIIVDVACFILSTYCGMVMRKRNAAAKAAMQRPISEEVIQATGDM